jgi:hypothetical protein
MEQIRRLGHQLGGSSTAGDFQEALFVGLHDVLIADPDNRIVLHVHSHAARARTRYAEAPWSFRGKK